MSGENYSWIIEDSESWCSNEDENLNRNHIKKAPKLWNGPLNIAIPVIFHWKTRLNTARTHTHRLCPPPRGSSGTPPVLTAPHTKASLTRAHTDTHTHSLTVTGPFTFQLHCNKYSNEHLRDALIPSASLLWSSIPLCSSSSSSTSSSLYVQCFWDKETHTLSCRWWHKDTLRVHWAQSRKLHNLMLQKVPDKV